MNICLCSAQSGYPHLIHCPFRYYGNDPKKIDEWTDKFLKNQESVWCRNCECFVHPSEMRISLSDDDITTKKSCNGCDAVLLEIKSERA